MGYLKRISEKIAQQLPRGRAYLVDQLQRAGTSIPFNIAEGAGEYSMPEKNRFYRIAKRSTTECAGIMDVLSVETARGTFVSRRTSVTFTPGCYVNQIGKKKH